MAKNSNSFWTKFTNSCHSVWPQNRAHFVAFNGFLSVFTIEGTQYYGTLLAKIQKKNYLAHRIQEPMIRNPEFSTIVLINVTVSGKNKTKPFFETGCWIW